MRQYTTHSLLEYSRDFDTRICRNRCEYAPNRLVPEPYTFRMDTETNMGTVLCPSSIKGVYFSMSGFVPVLSVVDDTENNLSSTYTGITVQGIKYYVGSHASLCEDVDGFGFPLSCVKTDSYKGGIDMIEKSERLSDTFTVSPLTRNVIERMCFMLTKNEDGCFWLSQNGMRIFSRGLGIEASWDGTDIEKETFTVLPIQAVYYLCEEQGFDVSFADDTHIMFRDRTECPRYVFVERSLPSSNAFRYVKPTYFASNAETCLHRVRCFTVRVPESGSIADAQKCDYVTLSPSDNGNVFMSLYDFRHNLITKVLCDAPFASCLGGKFTSNVRNRSICEMFMCGFSGVINVMKDDDGEYYIMVEFDGVYDKSSGHPFATLSNPDNRCVHMRVVFPVKYTP